MVQRERIWGLYRGSWNSIIVDDAFSHPAKYAKDMIYWLVRTGIERGWWTPGETTLLDPFAGVALGGLASAAHGLSWTGVELEQRFVDLGNENIQLHREQWERMGLPIPRLIQGDSRRLTEIVGEVGGSVLRPPYAQSMVNPGNVGNRMAERFSLFRETPVERGETAQNPQEKKYGTTSGQLGAMTEGKLGGVTSPPFSQPETRDRYPVKGHVEASGANSDAIAFQFKRKNPAPYTVDRQSDDPANIARLGGMTSPPYERSMTDHPHSRDAEFGAAYERSYGDNINNLGNQQGETYWSACQTIYQQLYDLFSPNSYLAIIVKPFVRNKTLVDLPAMTLDLLVQIGFSPVTWFDMMLTGRGKQLSMMPEQVPDYEWKRASFFRRLAESKGSPKINAEICLVVRKVEQGR